MANLFDLKPVRTCDWRQMEDGRVVVLVPRFRGRWLGRWLMPRLKRPYVQIMLDQFGSWVWLQCDGSQTVEDIALSLRERFGEAVEPVYERLAVFVKQLMRAELVALDLSSGSGHPSVGARLWQYGKCEGAEHKVLLEKRPWSHERERQN